MPRAIVTLAIGEEHRSLAERTHPLMARYARRLDAEFVVIDAPRLAYRAEGEAWLVWEKYQLADLLGRHERVVFFDTDVLVRPDCPDLMEFCGGRFGAFTEVPYNRTVLERLGWFCRLAGITVARPRQTYCNAGVMVCSRAHRAVFTPPPVLFNHSECPFAEQTCITVRLHQLGVACRDLPICFSRYDGDAVLAQRLSPADAEEIRRSLAADARAADVLRRPAATGFWEELFTGWHPTSGTCPWLVKGMYIPADGYAASCCFQKDPAVNALAMVGQATAGEMLRKRRELEVMLARGEPPTGCRDCGLARGVIARIARATGIGPGAGPGGDGPVSRPQSIVLGIGTGRCGLRSLAAVLNRQQDAQSSYEEPPWLPWERRGGQQVLRDRFARFRQNGKKPLLGDVASFYLPYLEDAIAVEPEVRVVCLRRPCEEVVASFCEWLDQNTPLPMNHWSRQPAPGWHHDPNRTRIYPQYETQNREEGIRRYWNEYYQQADELRRRFPDHIRVFDMCEALNTEAGLGELLGFVGIAPERQVLAVGTHVDRNPAIKEEGGGVGRPAPNAASPGGRALTPGPSPGGRGETGARPRQWAQRPSGSPMDPRRCVVLVPFVGAITPHCERHGAAAAGLHRAAGGRLRGHRPGPQPDGHRRPAGRL